MSTYDTGKAVGVADTDAGMTERCGRRHHLGGVGGAIEEREVGAGADLGERGRHARYPWRNQRGGRSGRCESMRPIHSRAPETNSTR